MPNIKSAFFGRHTPCSICGKDLFNTPPNEWSFAPRTRSFFHRTCLGNTLPAANPSPMPSYAPPTPSPEPLPESPKEVFPLNAETRERAKDLINQGNRIGAIKAIREQTNVGLDAAIQIAEKLQSEVLTEREKEQRERERLAEVQRLADEAFKKAKLANKTDHYCFERLLSYMQIRRSDGHHEDIYIPGAPGSGKSFAIKRAAAKLELRYAYIALSEATQPSQIFGYMDASGNYVPSLFYHFYKDGGVLDIAELYNTNANVFSMLNNALDNGMASFPCGMVERHANFIAIGNGNTDLRGPNDMFPQRQKQDAASIARFTFIFDWGYDEDLELALFPKHEKMVRWVQSLRKVIEQRKDKLVAGTREMRKIAGLLDAGIDVNTALRDGLFKNYQATKELLLAHPINF